MSPRSLLTVIVTITLATPAGAEDWYPSKYGAADTLGAANEMSADKVVEAAKLVRTGKTYRLGAVTGPETPAYPPRRFQMIGIAHGDGTGGTLGSNKAVAHDDLLITHLGIGTQIDGLGHLGIDHRYYNGAPTAEVFSPTGLVKYATHELPPFVTRGVLLDIAALKGKKQLAGGTAINRAEIDAAAKRQGVEIRRGDVVLLHTGWASMAEDNPAKFMEMEPGLGLEGARHLASLGVVAVGADSWALEVLPFENETEAFPVHQILLAMNGIYILENIQTAALAADEGFEFLFVLGVPRFEGAVQMVVNPIAIR